MENNISESTVYFKGFPLDENPFDDLSSVISRIDDAYDMYSGDWRRVRALFCCNNDNEALSLLLRYPDFFQKLF